MTELLNTRLGNYHLTEIIGRGHMSTVYKAYQPSLHRYVAVKVLLHTTDSHSSIARFKREAQVLTHMQHPHILPVYDFGEQNGRLYLVSQYVENSVTLSNMIGQRIEIGATLRLIACLLSALDYAHAYGMIHRDITPANVLLLSPVWPMLADFGIARLISGSLRLTRLSTIIGTTAYMAPERANGEIFDARADLYSIGVVLYELLAGCVPFAADTPAALILKQTNAPPPPRSINPDIPAEVEAVLLRALMKEADARYQSAAEMAQALEQVAARIELHPPPSASTGPSPHPVDMRAELYQAGLQAFRAGRWDIATERINQLIALDPANEDAPKLLEQVRIAQAYVRQQALRRAQDTPLQSAPREQTARRYATPHCPRCGRETQPEWMICPDCQASLRMPAEPDVSSSATARFQTAGRTRRRFHAWRNWARILLVLAAIGGALGLGIMQWRATTIQQPMATPATTREDAEDRQTPTTTLVADPPTVKPAPTPRPTQAPVPPVAPTLPQNALKQGAHPGLKLPGFRT
jgi:serine/threonine protein kinase